MNKCYLKQLRYNDIREQNIFLAFSSKFKYILFSFLLLHLIIQHTYASYTDSNFHEFSGSHDKHIFYKFIHTHTQTIRNKANGNIYFLNNTKLKLFFIYNGQVVSIRSESSVELAPAVTRVSLPTGAYGSWPNKFVSWKQPIKWQQHKQQHRRQIGIFAHETGHRGGTNTGKLIFRSIFKESWSTDSEMWEL